MNKESRHISKSIFKENKKNFKIYTNKKLLLYTKYQDQFL